MCIAEWREMVTHLSMDMCSCLRMPTLCMRVCMCICVCLWCVHVCTHKPVEQTCVHHRPPRTMCEDWFLRATGKSCLHIQSSLCETIPNSRLTSLLRSLASLMTWPSVVNTNSEAFLLITFSWSNNCNQQENPCIHTSNIEGRVMSVIMAGILMIGPQLI